MKRFLTFLLVLGLLISYSTTALAAPSASADYNEEAEARKSLPVQTNEIANWPTGPDLGAEAAYLLEANTGTVLYAKNMDEKLYPASTTKILTCLIAVENCSMDEVITFSHMAYSRKLFATGAVSAARFLAGKPAGMYDMSRVIEGK